MPPQCAGMLKNTAVFCIQKLKPPKVFLEYVGPPSPPGSVIDSGNVSVRFPGGKQSFWLAEDGVDFLSLGKPCICAFYAYTSVSTRLFVDIGKDGSEMQRI